MKRHQIFTRKGWKGHGEKSYRRKAGSQARINHYFHNHLNRGGRILFQSLHAEIFSECLTVRCFYVIIPLEEKSHDK